MWALVLVRGGQSRSSSPSSSPGRQSEILPRKQERLQPAAEITPASFLAPQQSGSPACCLPLLDWKAARACDVTGGRAKTLMVAGPSCSSLSCTSACGMQHLPTHNPSSSPLSVCPEPYPGPHVSVPQQPASKALGCTQGSSCEWYPACGPKGLPALGWGVPSANSAVNLIPPLSSFPPLFP